MKRTASEVFSQLVDVSNLHINLMNVDTNLLDVNTKMYVTPISCRNCFKEYQATSSIIQEKL